MSWLVLSQQAMTLVKLEIRLDLGVKSADFLPENTRNS